MTTNLALLGFALAVSAFALSGAPPAAEKTAPVVGSNGYAEFEPASIPVPAGSDCVLHPEGNLDPKESIPVSADEDGVARFLVLRPTATNSVSRLVLDCTDSKGSTKTYTVDLRSNETFAPRPFDASRATLAARPALAGDPLRLTQEELLKAGYGLRPDPTLDPDGYMRWLEAARIPAHKLRRADRSASTVPMPRPRSHRHPDLPQRSDQMPVPEINAKVYKSPSSGWTGAVLQGSYNKKATSTKTESYVWNAVTFNVPKVFPGPTAAMTIWNGLDNVLQAIVDVNVGPSGASFGIHHQNFNPTTTKGDDTAGARFTPNTGDTIYDEEWYCDAHGNLNLSGGYACTYMMDETQGLIWECDEASSSECTSYALKPEDLVNGKLGFWADFIIEDDTDEYVKSEEWPDFSPVTMTGSTLVVKGNGVSEKDKIKSVSTNNDPLVAMFTDDNTSTRHLIISLPVLNPGNAGVRWGQIVCPSDAKWKAASNACVCDKTDQKFTDGKCKKKK
ncbi:MAG: hypothetical protein WBR15_02050 [Gammaproteobacteria bacterium]